MSARSLFSPMWYRVADLRPRLRPHAQLHRQHFRGDLWYVLEDHSSGRFYRFSPAAHALIGLMDGQRTVREIWEQASERLGDDLPTQEEVIQLLSQLHAANTLTADSVPDVAEIADRAATQRRRKIMGSIRNPLGVRIPLLDPDRFLTATMPLVRPLFGWVGLLLWAGVVAYGLVLAGMSWSALTTNVMDRVLAAQNLTLLFVSYPFVKVLHELGHGYAVKRWGGEVHEMGIMFMVFVPIPYVDASASTAFQDKYRRMVVGGAGIMVELFLAALAVIVWVAVEPGVVRALAFNVMLIGGVSTLLFNGNPLLRFDGYYVFSDLIEVPNLAMRANRYLGYLVRRHLFGLGQATSPVSARGEPFWLFAYAISAAAYRLVIMTGIVLFVASKWFFIGVILAFWSMVMMFGMPLGKMVGYLFGAQELAEKRPRALAISAGFVVLLVGLIGFVPIPYGTVAEGVVWIPKERGVYAEAAGFVTGMPAGPGQAVEVGQLLVTQADPLLAARTKVLAAALREQEVRLAALEITDRVQADVTRERARQARARLARARQRLASLSVTSPARGRFFSPAGDDLTGRYLSKGQLIGYVLEPDDWFLRVVVGQGDIDLVKSRTRGVAVRFAEAPAVTHAARILRATPQATDQLPSAALGSGGGGRIPLSPGDPSGRRALQRVFVLDLAVDDPPPAVFFGGRVAARFDHGRQPAAMQLFRSLRQLLLRRFDI